MSALRDEMCLKKSCNTSCATIYIAIYVKEIRHTCL